MIKILIPIILGAICFGLLFLLSERKKYALTHIVLLDERTVKEVKTFGFHTYSSTLVAMETSIQELIGHGTTNLYYSNLIDEENGKKLVIRNVTHLFLIEKL